MMPVSSYYTAMKMKPPRKILVIRNDKIGDFMLAWPSFSLLKGLFPDIEITALVPEYTAPLAEECRWIDKVIIDTKKKNFIKDILCLTKKIKRENFDTSISLFSESRASISLWLARVNNRIGPATKLAQLFLNKTLKQKRSRSAKPEYEYNIDLIRFLSKTTGTGTLTPVCPPFLVFNKIEINTIKSELYKNHSINKEKKLFFIHPGTGGSAINLTLEQYAELAINMSHIFDIYIVITAGPGEYAAAERLSSLIKNTDHHIHRSTEGLIAFCKYIDICDVFISGSTGPLHIAGALNKKTVAFYPSKRSATSLRWKTINEDDKQLVFTLNDDTNKKEKLDMKNIGKEVICNLFNVA